MRWIVYILRAAMAVALFWFLLQQSLGDIRWWVAYLTVGSLPFALLMWYSIHPFVGFWRRMGLTVTYSFAAALLIANLWMVWQNRERLLLVEFGTGPVLWAFSALFYAAAIFVELQCRKYLKLSILVGVPELRPEPGGGTLLQEGIYGRIRHPRYVSVMLGMTAAALFCNYYSTWLCWAVTLPGLVGVVYFEERELRARFGDAYEDYSRRVPRFIPRFAT